MAIKCFQAKVICRSPAQRQALEQTHRLFNEHLGTVVSILYSARHGRYGPPEYRDLYRQVLSVPNTAQAATACVEALTKLGWSPKDLDQGLTEWKKAALILHQTAEKLPGESKKQILLFDRDERFIGVKHGFKRKLFDEAFQIILSHEEKHAAWREEHEQWLKDRTKWEADNPEYMAVRSVIEQFEQQEGMVSKRRGRWHRWLDFLQSHPELAAWHGGESKVVPLTEQEKAEAAKNPRKTVARTFEFFWAKNPDLKALDQTHGDYERKFARSWAKRKNNDGFKHPPTLTLPSPDKHPRWYQFKKTSPITCKGLDLQNGIIKLEVVGPETSEQLSRMQWQEYRFLPDPRFQRFQPIKDDIISGREKCDLLYTGNDGPSRPATIKGVKLVFKGDQSTFDAKPAYLYFTVYIEDKPSRLAITQRRIDKFRSTARAFETIKNALPESSESPLRCMAIDLGIRHIGAATVMEGDRLLATRFIHNKPELPSGENTIRAIPTLAQIATMKRKVRQMRRKRGKPVKGELSCRRLQKHILQMSEDRFKKSAAAIIALARSFRVDIILIEQLMGLIPDAERERGINKALVNWNRGNTVKWLKMLAEENGLRILEIPPQSGLRPQPNSF
ncbi:MAG: transposase [Phycisphaerales bacterium]|nr:transposase [Phycisphaerales bacterium]